MPDLLIHNARIWTGDPTAPHANAALVRDGRFVFAGDERDVATPAGAARLDARSRMVVPGLTDGHAHLLGAGFPLHGIDLKGVPSPDDAARTVGERAAAAPAGTWIRGTGWDQNLWPGARFPHRSVLDAVAPEHPVILTQTSGHCVWVNSVALRLAGIDDATEAPFGGAIDRDAAGAPTGILRDAASRLVEDIIPHPTPGERIAALRAAIAHAHALGITGTHAMNVGRGEYQAMLALADTGRLAYRIRAFMTAERLDEWIARGMRTGDGDDMMRIGGVKFFTDGALGSLTAWMLEPYEGRDDIGLPMQPADEFETSIRRCIEHGLAPAIHAIGDRANRVALDILERARDMAPALPRRIEHAQLLTPADIPRFAALGVTASMQPIHATQDIAKVDREWGSRGAYAYAFASLARSGANVAFGSDAPVEDMNPLAGIHAAVTRRRANGEPAEGWRPAERVSVDAALAAYTSGCARAVREDDRFGRIAPGYHADFAVLSHDLGAIEPMQIASARAEITYVAGARVFARDA